MRKELSFYLFGLGVLFLFVIFLPKEEDLRKEFPKRVKISLRDMGNQLLLSNGDSTSLVLPVRKLNDVEYELSFQSHLQISPDSLVTFIKKGIEKSGLPKSYRVEVLQCIEKEVAYSYEMNKDIEKTIIPCRNRVLPQECYTIQIQFLYLPTSWTNYKIISAVIILTIIFLLEFLFRFFRKKREDKKEDKSKNYTSIGSFQFYPEQNKLIKEAKEIALSNKERELLEILITNVNQVVKREDLTKRVWEDNGVFVGRSLDTYISKLRKKLQEDNTIKITNVHGVGYKLEINA